MKDTAADDTVIDRLLGALESNALPPAALDYAKHLLNRLTQPVRISVFGTPKSGKSELINMFVGEQLIPKDAQLPTTEFTWGEAEAMMVTSADGATEQFDRVDLNAVSGSNAAFLRVELPVPILKRIRLLEVVTEGSAAELESATDWAVRRTDIALWCTQDFDTIEQSVWSRVPDGLKDHAFLVVTKADILSAQKALSQKVAALESIVAEEFHSLFAVATLQAIRAQASAEVDTAMLQASGGNALSSEVLRHAERGRRADFDSAHMFLARYQITDVPAGKGATENVELEQTEAPAPVSENVTPDAEPVPEADPTPPSAPEPVVQVETAVAEPKPVAAVKVVVPKAVPVENVKIFAEAVHFLKRRGEGLTQTVATLNEGATNDIVGQCINSVEHLVDTFSQDESGCEAADAFIDDLSEAADLMVLMQTEAGDAPAADAVTLLLQLRRDIEMQLAA
ncbi:MAG: hypothetical protein ABJF50_02175 [Paracoccaceae bacterium]